jgi:hypothetical protein
MIEKKISSDTESENCKNKLVYFLVFKIIDYFCKQKILFK